MHGLRIEPTLASPRLGPRPAARCFVTTRDSRAPSWRANSITDTPKEQLPNFSETSRKKLSPLSKALFYANTLISNRDGTHSMSLERGAKFSHVRNGLVPDHWKPAQCAVSLAKRQAGEGRKHAGQRDFLGWHAVFVVCGPPRVSRRCPSSICDTFPGVSAQTTSGCLSCSDAKNITAPNVLMDLNCLKRLFIPTIAHS